MATKGKRGVDRGVRGMGYSLSSQYLHYAGVRFLQDDVRSSSCHLTAKLISQILLLKCKSADPVPHRKFHLGTWLVGEGGGDGSKVSEADGSNISGDDVFELVQQVAARGTATCIDVLCVLGAVCVDVSAVLVARGG
jgi:hypothetical protein